MGCWGVPVKAPEVGPLGGTQRTARNLGNSGDPEAKAGPGTLSHRRTGRCCKGHVWISPRKTNLQFCLYW